MAKAFASVWTLGIPSPKPDYCRWGKASWTWINVGNPWDFHFSDMQLFRLVRSNWAFSSCGKRPGAFEGCRWTRQHSQGSTIDHPVGNPELMVQKFLVEATHHRPRCGTGFLLAGPSHWMSLVHFCLSTGTQQELCRLFAPASRLRVTITVERCWELRSVTWNSGRNQLDTPRGKQQRSWQVHRVHRLTEFGHHQFGTRLSCEGNPLLTGTGPVHCQTWPWQWL
jgi:hypothetical protein